MRQDETREEHTARLLQNPGFAAARTVGRPFFNLALNVWSRRIEKGLTQQQLAEAAKMKQPRIADIERDEANPTLLTISRIAFALGVTADQLLAEPNDELLASARAAVEAAAGGRGKRRRAARDDSARVPQAEPHRRRATA